VTKSDLFELGRSAGEEYKAVLQNMEAQGSFDAESFRMGFRIAVCSIALLWKKHLAVDEAPLAVLEGFEAGQAGL